MTLNSLYLQYILIPEVPGGVWALVLLADFVLEFRFEYLWPFWLFIRSVYDSFRYQGLVCLLIYFSSIKDLITLLRKSSITTIV